MGILGGGGGGLGTAIVLIEELGLVKMVWKTICNLGSHSNCILHAYSSSGEGSKKNKKQNKQTNKQNKKKAFKPAQQTEVFMWWLRVVFDSVLQEMVRDC